MTLYDLWKCGSFGVVGLAKTSINDEPWPWIWCGNFPHSGLHQCNKGPKGTSFGGHRASRKMPAISVSQLRVKLKGGLKTAGHDIAIRESTVFYFGSTLDHALISSTARSPYSRSTE